MQRSFAQRFRPVLGAEIADQFSLDALALEEAKIDRGGSNDKKASRGRRPSNGTSAALSETSKLKTLRHEPRRRHQVASG
jgi:hypothetical protein